MSMFEKVLRIASARAVTLGDAIAQVAIISWLLPQFTKGQRARIRAAGLAEAVWFREPNSSNYSWYRREIT
jgi:hypothetical protein